MRAEFGACSAMYAFFGFISSKDSYCANQAGVYALLATYA
jgi:hypothetical protein